MIKIKQNNYGDVVGYGNENAPIQFMLPTPPKSLENNQSIEDIVELNGNHWRKIFVIIAKLCCRQKQWQKYRSENLLNEVYLNFSLKPNFNKQINIVCGKQHAQSMGIFEESLNWGAIDTLMRIRANTKDSAHKIVVTPYLDYRQFPNALIEEVVNFYSSNGFSNSVSD